jgi:ribose 5-phosphate isomerase A
MNPKQRAAEAAIQFVKSDSVIGLGTGSTADFFLQSLASAIKTGALQGVRGVPTSVQTERRATELGIPLSTLALTPRLALTVDGADEIDPHLNLIKGLGGALLREKLVAQCSDLLVIIADAGKQVPSLGAKCSLPVEVAQFGFEVQADFLRSLGCEPVLRAAANGAPYQTDNGNFIYDCRFRQIADPSNVEAILKQRAGIVATGLFIQMAGIALIGDDTTVHRRQAPPR